MPDSFFRGVFDTDSVSVISPSNFLLCVGVSLALGLLLAFLMTRKSDCGRSFFVTASTLPTVVCVVIMLVNGNVGTGVAVAGAFSLVRFRSVPGTAREIGIIFAAMGTGLICGMGYLGYALLFTLVFGGVTLLFYSFLSNRDSQEAKSRTLHITIPECLDYCGVFDPVLEQYSSDYHLKQVKTTNMGSLFKLTYDLTLRHCESEKPFIDELRRRNGNLEISLCPRETNQSSL